MDQEEAAAIAKRQEKEKRMQIEIEKAEEAAKALRMENEKRWKDE